MVYNGKIPSINGREMGFPHFRKYPYITRYVLNTHRQNCIHTACARISHPLSPSSSTCMQKLCFIHVWPYAAYMFFVCPSLCVCFAKNRRTWSTHQDAVSPRGRIQTCSRLCLKGGLLQTRDTRGGTGQKQIKYGKHMINITNVYL